MDDGLCQSERLVHVARHDGGNPRASLQRRLALLRPHLCYGVVAHWSSFRDVGGELGVIESRDRRLINPGIIPEPLPAGLEPLHSLPHLQVGRSEEHTSELQALMRTSYALLCLKKKDNNNTENT